MFMAASWHLPVRELQGRKALIGIIRSSVTSTCPPRDVSDDLVSVFTQLTGSYQHRVPRPRGLLGLLGLLAATTSRRHPGSFVISSRFAVQRPDGHSCITLVRFLFPVQIHAANLSNDEQIHPALISFSPTVTRRRGRRHREACWTPIMGSAGAPTPRVTLGAQGCLPEDWSAHTPTMVVCVPRPRSRRGAPPAPAAPRRRHPDAVERPQVIDAAPRAGPPRSALRRTPPIPPVGEPSPSPAGSSGADAPATGSCTARPSSWRWP